MSKRWIRCKVQKGMFSDELLVVIRTENGENAAFFVPKSEVNLEAADLGKLRVGAFDQNARAWAMVPNDQQSIVLVDRSEFIAA